MFGTVYNDVSIEEMFAAVYNDESIEELFDCNDAYIYDFQAANYF